MPKMAKNSKNHAFRLLIEFESFDLAGNGLKRFLLWCSKRRPPFTHVAKFRNWAWECQEVPNMAENVPKVFGLLIEFGSFDLTVNGLKQFLL